MNQVQAKIAHQAFSLDPADVERQLRRVLPAPIGEHFVVIGGRRFPPKQVVEIITGLDKADFNTHQARNLLRRLGFVVGRRVVLTDNSVPQPPEPGPHAGQEAEALRSHAGQWVAQRGLEVLVAADSPEAVLAWLEQHDQQADAMFRVPIDIGEATGMAPL